MVDPVGYKPAAKLQEQARVAAPAVAQPVRTTDATSAAPTALASTAAALRAAPPVDAERVERIRRAIAEGKFPILPATIADRLLALKMEWHSNDPA